MLGLRHIDQHAGAMPGPGQTTGVEFAHRRLVGAGALYPGGINAQRRAGIENARLNASAATACDRKIRGGTELGEPDQRPWDEEGHQQRP